MSRPLPAPIPGIDYNKNRSHDCTIRIHDAITYPCGLLNGASFAARSITL